MQTWTTDAVASHEQFSYWREVLCEAFVSLNPIRIDSEPVFRGSVRSRSFGETTQTMISASAQHNDRRLQEIRRDPVEFCFANFQQQGTCFVRQDGRETLVRPNEFYIVDTTRPYFLAYSSNWQVLSFRIPRHQLGRRVGTLRHATARRIGGSTGLGLVATQFARSLGTLDDSLTVSKQEGLSSALTDLLGLTLGSSTDPSARDDSTIRGALRRTIESYIDDHLTDPLLSPESIAARFNISRRYIYSLFESEPLSVSGFIRARRLEACARELSTTACPAVLDIAMRWGFNDASHFSRLFKQHYGASPRSFAQKSRTQ
ncbi:helix-turn-helix domain-containing protein [Variovorax ginsengisoli]|uniref:AraC-like DNA-binding protein n=1 Tax=Variovorax ginsengisoli TaxID=363844 RepID=A0ABT9SBL7_9BURK|nr:helix-turn-helix domain-containing protein [Variovorax ginsengisoli]MDP9901754.1 AraC-like DNA-binding protein [Variovorax ginsengisoli]